MFNLISAKDAKQRTEQSASKPDWPELYRVNRKIKEATKYGQLSIDWEGRLKDSTLDLLQESGYHILAGRNYSNIHYCISWE